ncbi:NAD-dependent epimerase [candidate division KSB1 bacterium]|nr:NAD-dependent epimerase [candidate division KSB1 bacterium]
MLNKKILVTGCAGFIGFHVSQRLLLSGYSVMGLDNLNDYYDVRLKEARLEQLGIKQQNIDFHQVITSLDNSDFRFTRLDLSDKTSIVDLFNAETFNYVIHLGAQAGVRHSLDDPHTYINTNITGFLNVLEGCRTNAVDHLVFASSSSVYGLNQNTPFSVHNSTDHPISLYAATKRSNELMAHTYSQLFGIPLTGLRFFTAYGPWGRPDMALFKFTKAIIAGDQIEVYNYGKMKRDFTYIDDLVDGLMLVFKKPPRANASWNAKNPDPASSSAPYRILNIGNNKPVTLLDFIRTIEEALGKKAKLELLPLQPGDVPEAQADVSDMEREFGYRPKTSIQDGIRKFVDWYLNYYQDSYI